MNAPSVFKTPAGEQAVMALYDAILEKWPVPCETMMIPTRHGETFVVASGDASAPPMILLHGAGSCSAVWVGEVAEYSRHFRVYAVDLLGEAGRSAPNRPSWSSPAYAEWLNDVLDALKIDTAILVGLSQGAWTILKFATWKPERAAKLVLMTPGGVIPDKMSFLARAVLSMLLGKRGTRNLVRSLFGDQSIPDGTEEALTTVTRHFKPRMGVLPLFSDDDLRRLTMPVFLIGGTKDVVRDLNKIAARLQPLLPDLTVTIIPGAGHALLNTTGHVMGFLGSGDTK